MEGFVDNCSEVLTEKFTGFAAKGEVINLGHWMQCYAFDVIGEITVAKRFGFLDLGEDIAGLMSSIDTYLFYLSHVGIYPWLHPILSKIIMAWAPPEKGMGYTRVFTARQIDQRQRNLSEMDEKRGDFLTRTLNLHRDDPAKFTMQDVFVACMTNIGAGSDTTSISLSSVLYHLCRYPRTLDVLREEIDSKGAKGEISNPLSFSEAQNMPYLQAVIKEALRMHPATGFPLLRDVPEGGAEFAGHYFPAGTSVGVNAWVAHSNQQVFGPDASIFRPERWLEKEAGSQQESYFFAFGQGSRTCIGKNISLMEMTKVIPQIVRNFDLELVNPEKDWSTYNMWFVKQKDFYVRLRLRSKA